MEPQPIAQAIAAFYETRLGARRAELPVPEVPALAGITMAAPAPSSLNLFEILVTAQTARLNRKKIIDHVNVHCKWGSDTGPKIGLDLWPNFVVSGRIRIERWDSGRLKHLTA